MILASICFVSIIVIAVVTYNLGDNLTNTQAKLMLGSITILIGLIGGLCSYGTDCEKNINK